MAETLEVPGEFPSVQSAVDAAVDGDVIQLAPGRYRGNVVIAGKSLTLRSAIPPSGNSIRIPP